MMIDIPLWSHLTAVINVSLSVVMFVIVIAELFHYPWRWQWWRHVFHKYPLYRL